MKWLPWMIIVGLLVYLLAWDRISQFICAADPTLGFCTTEVGVQLAPAPAAPDISGSLNGTWISIRAQLPPLDKLAAISLIIGFLITQFGSDNYKTFGQMLSVAGIVILVLVWTGYL